MLRPRPPSGAGPGASHQCSPLPRRSQPAGPGTYAHTSSGQAERAKRRKVRRRHSGHSPSPYHANALALLILEHVLQHRRLSRAQEPRHKGERNLPRGGSGVTASVAAGTRGAVRGAPGPGPRHVGPYQRTLLADAGWVLLDGNLGEGCARALPGRQLGRSAAQRSQGVRVSGAGRTAAVAVVIIARRLPPLTAPQRWRLHLPRRPSTSESSPRTLPSFFSQEGEL